MEYIVVLIGIAILFALFLTYFLLKSLKESDQQRIVVLLDDLAHEKQQCTAFELDDDNQNRREYIQHKMLTIRLELLNTEEDLKEVIPRLLN